MSKKKKKKRSKNLPYFSCHVLQHTKFYNTTQPVFPERGGRGIKKCVGGEQIFSEVASKSHYRNLKYFPCLLCADYKAATVKINVGKKKEREVKFTSFFLSFAAAYQIL